MIDRIMQSLDESAQVHYGRHTIRHVSLQLAIDMKKSNNRERKDFENAILQIGRESTPFSDPPNRISHYQVTLLLSMATEMKLMDFTDIVIENLSLLNHFSKSDAVDIQEIKKFCLKFLYATRYKNVDFWVDLLQSKHTEPSQKSIAATILCNSHANLVFDQFDVLFSDENAHRGVLAWNIYSKVDKASCFVECMSNSKNDSKLQRFLNSLNDMDPSGKAGSRFREMIDKHNPG